MVVNFKSAFKKRVYEKLYTIPATRDNDGYLYALILHEDLVRKGYDPKTTSCFDLFLFMKTAKVSNPESVRRMRQKIQEECPDLRGSSYRARKKKADEVRMTI